MTDSAPTVGEVIDDIPLGRFHWRFLAITGTVWATTALEILIISFTIPVFRDIWALTPLEAGLLGSAGLFGMIFGNSLGGWYADRAGRKRALAASVAFFSVWTGLTAFATGFVSAFVLRLLTGLGVGATIAVDASFLTEHVPTDQRGRYLAYLEMFFAVGNLLTVALAWVVLPGDLLGGTVLGFPAWRVFYAVAAGPLVLVLVIHWWLDESPYYLASKGKATRATERLRAMAAENNVEVAVAPGAIQTREGSETGFRRLFRPDVLRTTVLASLLWFGINFGYYGVIIWLPDTVQAAGYVGGLYGYLFVVGIFQFLGVVAAAAVVDRLGRKATLALSFTLAGVATAAFTVAIPGVDVGLGIEGRLPFLVGLFGSGFFVFAVFAVIFAYTTELFPTEVRSTGLGFTGGVGKIAAVIGPILFGYLVEYGYLVALAPVVASLLAAGLVVAVFGEETMGQTLT